MNTGTSIYIVERIRRSTDHRYLVGAYESKELADAAGAESLEFQDADDCRIEITIVPLNGKLG